MQLKTLVQLFRAVKTAGVQRTGSFPAMVVAIDALTTFLVSISYFAAISWVSPGTVSPVLYALLFTALSVIFLLYFRTQKFIWRFISVGEILPFTAAAALTTATGYLILLVLGALPATDGGALVRAASLAALAALQIALLAAGWLSTRAIWRLMQDQAEMSKDPGKERPRVLLVSIGPECYNLLRSLAGAHDPIRAVGILDFNPHQAGREVRGVPVLGSPDELAEIVAALSETGQRPEEVVLTTPLPEHLLLDVIERAVALKLKVSKLPPPGEMRELLGRGLSPTQPVTLQAVVGREPLEFDRTPTAALVAGKRIMVTGAGGSIGSQLVELIAGFGPAQLCLIDNSEFNLWKIQQQIATRFPDLDCLSRLVDIRDATRLRQVFSQTQPQLVFHAAALKHVPMVEVNQAEGVLTNVIGTRNVADAALDAGVEAMVQVSTDKAVMPTSVMGATKRLAEIYCQALDLAQTGPRFMTVRFGNVLGSSGSVVPVFQKQIAAGGPVTVTHPQMERYFMTITEACELVLHSAAHATHDSRSRGLINVLDMGKPVKIVDIARRMILLQGLMPDEDIRIEFTGIRPGEKLVEELFNDAEAQTESAVAGFHTALSEAVPLATITAIIARLADLASDGNNGEIMNVLKAVVPGYHTPPVVARGSEAA